MLEEVHQSATESPYVIQARIAAIHSTSPSHSDTDWATIVDLYRWLYELKPSPVVALNHAAAVAMAEGEPAGLALMELLTGVLAGYQPFHAARAELLARAGRSTEAAAELSYCPDLSNQRRRAPPLRATARRGRSAYLISAVTGRSIPAMA